MDKNYVEKRVNELKECKTPKDLAYNIWTLKQEEYMGDRSIYRNPFIEWIDSYRLSKSPTMWTGYTTPQELSEGIWKPFLDREDDNGLFIELRLALVNWIVSYKKQYVSQLTDSNLR